MLNRIDPNNAFRVDVKVEAFHSKEPDGRKLYTKGRTVSWVLESNRCTMQSLMVSLSSEVSWGESQTPTVWYFDRKKGEDVRLVSDSQVPGMFDMYKDERHFQLIVAVFDHGVAMTYGGEAQLNNDSDNLSQTNLNAPCPANTIGSKSTNNIEAQPPDDPCDDPDEYVGVDDEHMYDVPFNAAVQQNDITDEANVVNAVVPVEAEINDEVDCEVVIAYDRENPNIEEKAMFPDMVTFRKAIRHYAVKTGFELCNVRTDTTRFIAKCKGENCNWRVHASRLPDRRTIMVCGPSYTYFFE